MNTTQVFSYYVMILIIFTLLLFMIYSKNYDVDFIKFKACLKEGSHHNKITTKFLKWFHLSMYNYYCTISFISKFQQAKLGFNLNFLIIFVFYLIIFYILHLINLLLQINFLSLSNLLLELLEILILLKFILIKNQLFQTKLLIDKVFVYLNDLFKLFFFETFFVFPFQL